MSSMKTITARAGAWAAAALLAACAVGPTYRPPAQTPAPAILASADPDAASFPAPTPGVSSSGSSMPSAAGGSAAASAAPTSSASTAVPTVSTHLSSAPPSARWWTQLGDAELASLETRALAKSPDLDIALARVRAARAAFTESKLNLTPHVTLDGAYARSKEQYPGFSDRRLDIESKSVGFDAAWEIDLFGHLRREAEQAQGTLQAEQAAFQDAQVTLAAEVAREYFGLRGTQRRLDVAASNIANEREALRLTRIRYEAGRVTELDADSATARLKATEATVPLLEAEQKRHQYRLAVLLGAAPGSLDAELSAAPARVITEALPVGDVRELLRHRPDVRQAERQLAAATAQVGVATADLFPRVTFQGFVGFLAGDGGELGKARTYAWSLAPTVSWPALDYGSVHARLRAAKAQADGALAAYEKTVLLALEDFQNACVNYGAQQSRLIDVAAQAAASRRAADLATIQYTEGSINFLVLLDAQRTLLQAEDELAQAQADANVGAVAVYKALGGLGEEARRSAQAG